MPPGPCHRHCQKPGGCSSCKGSVLGLWAGCQTQPQQGHLIYAFLSLISTLQFLLLFIPHYFQFAISQLHLSLFCPQNQAPLTNTFQEKLQQNEKDKVCPRPPSSPLPAAAADCSLWEDESS